ncbi:nickel ABC transporter substrate-binding protein [Campylobacter canadensis]|uniref:Nickel ABC transporter, nickel/metallophore periplasmic binding protein n=1 Tax=Campylobacter canadensis TaxID=449520 RepID=A0ABS7WSJ7_9BACT|nr:nickel ABC transporter substrate-binding protein [Campylobacter canadensis]MBZ7987336.1 nickel ABC transporter, nickel/metallophore periplasmic binding protein [Campylobacter canadensis]MBZ7998493.1 nickel ABC transporter, nickel/metallophore periplasmic binding protein [Campylobacter canadensis]
MKKVLVLLSLIFALLNASELKFATQKNVGELNPHLYSPNEMFAQNMVYEGFVAYSEDNKIIPALATSWDISKDGLVYTFYLRKGVKFSNGEDFNANVVKANFDAIFANKQRHISFALVRAFDRLEVVDDYTVKIHLKHIYEPTLRELSLIRPFRFIAPSAMIDGNTKDGIKAAIGTGKWIFVDTKLGVYDKFKKNENYWEEKAKVDDILCKVIPDPSTRVIALKTGEIDYVYGMGAIGLEDFVNFKDTEFKTIISEPLSTVLIALNTGANVTKDIKLRKALNMAIDKDAISKYVFYGTQKRADFFYPENVPNGKIDRKAYEYNPKKAQKMLIDNGYKLGKDKMLYKDNKPLEIRLSFIGTNAEHKAIAEVMQSQLRQIGINLILNADESTIFYKRQRTGEFDMTFNETWGAPYEPEIFMASMIAPSHADYMAQKGLKQKALIDSNIEKIAQTMDNEEKIKLAKEILTILHDEAVYIPIVYTTNKGVASPKIKGYKSSILKYAIPFDDIEFEK